MKKLTILISLNCLTDNLSEAWGKYLNKSVIKDGVNGDFKNATIASPEIPSKTFFAPLYTKEFWEREVRPSSGAAECLNRLINDGHKVVVTVTPKLGDASLKINSFLLRCFPYVRKDDVVITQNPEIVAGDILIGNTLYDLACNKHKKILFNTPNNHDFHKAEYNIDRVSSWDEIYSIINKTALQD